MKTLLRGLALIGLLLATPLAARPVDDSYTITNSKQRFSEWSRSAEIFRFPNSSLPQRARQEKSWHKSWHFPPEWVARARGLRKIVVMGWMPPTSQMWEGK